MNENTAPPLLENACLCVPNLNVRDLTFFDVDSVRLFDNFNGKSVALKIC